MNLEDILSEWKKQCETEERDQAGTCGQCVYWDKCSETFIIEPRRARCVYNPSRFRLVARGSEVSP